MVLVKKYNANGLYIASTIKKPSINKSKHALEWAKTANRILESFSYMQEFSGETFVIKCDGQIMKNPSRAKQFAEDLVLIKKSGINPIVVYCDECQTDKILKNIKVESTFAGKSLSKGISKNTYNMAISGMFNKEIVTLINSSGGMAVGISGKDGGMIEAKKSVINVNVPNSNIEKIIDLGFLGEPTRINPILLQELSGSNIIPVISPIGLGANGETLILNADLVAAYIAASVAAEKLIIISYAPHIFTKDGNKIAKLSFSEAIKLMEQKNISMEIIRKIDTCIYALKNDCGTAHILDGSLPNILAMAIFTDLPSGTAIYSDSSKYSLEINL